MPTKLEDIAPTMRVERYAIKRMVQRQMGHSAMRIFFALFIAGIASIFFAPLVAGLWWLTLPVVLVCAPFVFRELLGLRRKWQIDAHGPDGKNEVIRVSMDQVGVNSERAFDLVDNTQEQNASVMTAQHGYRFVGRILSAVSRFIEDGVCLYRLATAPIDQMHWMLTEVATGRSSATVKELRSKSEHNLAPAIRVAVLLPGVLLMESGDGPKIAVTRMAKRELHGLSVD